MSFARTSTRTVAPWTTAGTASLQAMAGRVNCTSSRRFPHALRAQNKSSQQSVSAGSEEEEEAKSGQQTRAPPRAVRRRRGDAKRG